MDSNAILIADSNQFRAAAFCALLSPWASRSETEVSVVSDLDDVQDMPEYDHVATILCLGGASLCDAAVARLVAHHLARLKQQPLIVLSDLTERQEVLAAFEIGLSGFIPTTMPAHVVLAAIQFIMAGGVYLPHSLYGVTHAPAPESGLTGAPEPVPLQIDPAGAARLKPRHVEVLTGLQRGDSNKVIARRLNLTEATIKLYVRQLMKIFDAKNRTALALKSAAHPQLHPKAAPIPEPICGANPGAAGATATDLPGTTDETGSSSQKGSRWVSLAEAGRGEIVTRHSQFKAHQYLLRRERESRQPPFQETS